MYIIIIFIFGWKIMNKKVKLLVLGYITVAQFAALSSNSIVFAKDLNERSKAEIMDNMSEEVIYTILFILIIDAVQLVKNIFKINYKVVTIFQVIACIIGLYYGYTYFIFLITILLFDLLYEKVTVYNNIIISIGILLILKISEINMENIINYIGSIQP